MSRSRESTTAAWWSCQIIYHKNLNGYLDYTTVRFSPYNLCVYKKIDINYQWFFNFYCKGLNILANSIDFFILGLCFLQGVICFFSQPIKKAINPKRIDRLLTCVVRIILIDLISRIQNVRVF